MNRTRPNGLARRRAFTLLEVIVVIAVIALMAGVLAPAEVQRDLEMRLATTRAKIVRLRSAVSWYIEDTLDPPADLLHLGTDPGVDGWLGPYMIDSEVADHRGNGAFHVDAFGTPFQLTSSGDAVLITSFGPDRALAGGDDIVEVVSTASIRRAVTRRKLALVNAALRGYLNHDGTPLTGTTEDIRLRLAQAGLMPYGSDDSLFRDAWGDLFIPDPNTTPVVKYTSSHLE